MAKYTRIEVVNKMNETGLVPLFYHHDVEVSKKVMTACYTGGARVLEFTNRGDFAHEVFADLSKYAAKELPGMALGIGSVTDANTASYYMQMGANFVVTPVLREDVASVCNRRKVLWLPGCGSLTEISKAEELGCEIVKLFPGETYKPSFVKSVLGPQPWTSIMPTGGVDASQESLETWFLSGVTCVGIGSKLITQDVVNNEHYDDLVSNVSDILAMIAKIRSS